MAHIPSPNLAPAPSIDGNITTGSDVLTNKARLHVSQMAINQLTSSQMT